MTGLSLESFDYCVCHIFFTPIIDLMSLTREIYL